jgi:P pilus assembly chaperone PapD
MKKKKKFCDCGFPQSSPIPHEHCRNRELITNIINNNPTPFYTVFKTVKNKQKSIILTKRMLDPIYSHAQEIKKEAQLIIKLPIINENYVLTCVITKEKAN